MTEKHRYSHFYKLFPKIFTLFKYKYWCVKVKMDHLFSVLLTALHKGQLHFQDPNIGSGKVVPWPSIYLRKGEIKEKFIAFSSPEFHICIKRRVVSLDRNYENRRCQDSTCIDTHYIHMPSLFGLLLDCFLY